MNVVWRKMTAKNGIRSTAQLLFWRLSIRRSSKSPNAKPERERECVKVNTLAATPPHGRDTLTVHRQPHGVDKFFKWDFCQSYCRYCHAQGRRQKYGHSLTFWRIMASNSFGQGTISIINCLGRFRVFPCDACWYWLLKSNLFRNCCNSKCFTLLHSKRKFYESALNDHENAFRNITKTH